MTGTDRRTKQDADGSFAGSPTSTYSQGSTDPPADYEQPTAQQIRLENRLLVQQAASLQLQRENDLLKQQMMDLRRMMEDNRPNDIKLPPLTHIENNSGPNNQLNPRTKTSVDEFVGEEEEMISNISSDTTTMMADIESPTGNTTGGLTAKCSEDTDDMDSDGDGDEARCKCGDRWTEIIDIFRIGIDYVLQSVSSQAVKFPVQFAVGIPILSIAILALGYFTNFHVEVNEESAWTPYGSPTLAHSRWINYESNFPKRRRYIALLFHANGENVLEHAGKDGMSQLFEGLDAIRNIPGYYDEVCNTTISAIGIDSDVSVGADVVKECSILGATSFWGNNETAFEEAASLVTAESGAVYDAEDLKLALSSKVFPDGKPAVDRFIYGHAKRDETNILQHAEAYFVILLYPNTEEAYEFEYEAIESILQMREDWRNNNAKLKVEITATRSLGDELTRTIVKDMPLIPVVFMIMSIFTCCVFMKRHPVYSRSLLGFGAVVSVMLSLMSGYGLLFVLNVPFTSMSQILPFIIFGIGLDNSFIIIGSYNRTSRNKNIQQRIGETMHDIGNSIFLTTTTSTIAFGLGALSTVPSVRSLCLYAFTTIMLVFLYQLTFFIALIVLDERRIQNNLRNLCCFLKYEADDEKHECRSCTDENPSEPGDFLRQPELQHSEGVKNPKASMSDGNFIDGAMAWYTKQILRPWVKAIVILLFTQLFFICAYSASKLTQEFSFTDVVPKDSYITPFYNAASLYTQQNGVVPQVFFRDVDQSKHSVHQQMMGYIEQLLRLEQFNGDQPPECWVTDFNDYRAEKLVSKLLSPVNTNIAEDVKVPTFNEQLDDFLSDPVYHYLYSEDIVRDEVTGDITSSRCWVYMDNIDQEDVEATIQALQDQRRVTESQPINQNAPDGRWSFFTYDSNYSIWEFYSVAVQELTFSTVMGVIAVSAVALTLIPHWTSLLIVFPLICILYIDLLGILQLCGVHINGISYVSLVMAIGLMVDFIMHVLLRYYECKKGTPRDQRVKETLTTMGSSVLLGALSTLLGVIPLGFASSNIVNTIFISFIALVMLGVGHGLMLLPVVLSIVGPTR